MSIVTLFLFLCLVGKPKFILLVDGCSFSIIYIERGFVFLAYQKADARMEHQLRFATKFFYLPNLRDTTFVSTADLLAFMVSSKSSFL